jgi:hypothetical protein
MGIFEADVKVGVKHPGVYGTTVRHEIDVFDLTVDHTATLSIGNVEYLGFSGEWSPTDFDGLHPGTKFAGLKADVPVAFGPVPGIVGGTINPLDGKAAGRVGVGTPTANVYVEVEVTVNIPDWEDLDAGMVPGYRGYGQALPGHIQRELMEELGIEGLGVEVPRGYEYNALDLLAAEYAASPNGAPSITPGPHNFTIPEGNDPAPERPGSRPAPTPMDLAGGGPGTPQPGFSAPSPTGYSSRDVYDLEGPEAAGAGNGNTGFGNRNRSDGPQDGGRGGGGRDQVGGTGATASGDRGDGTRGGSGNGGGRDQVGGTGATASGSQGDGTRGGSSSSGGYHSDDHYENRGNGGPGYGLPILLDLDGDGEIEITRLDQSQMFTDTDGDGLRSRTAWAGEGDGVLFFDADGDGTLSEAREYIFTEWDPTAGSDIEALRSRFDTNKDGQFSAADDDWADFRVLVTNADGTQSVRTLTDLGITSIDLSADATQIVLPDGSVITGQTTFTRADGSEGTVADVILRAEAAGYRVETTTPQPGTVVQTGYHADGSVAFVFTAVTAPDGSSTLNSYDDNGDGVVDRLQVIEVAGQGTAEVRTVSDYVGNDLATAVLVRREQTARDGDTVTISRDTKGGGWFDQVETRVTDPDTGAMTITIVNLAQDGTVLRRSTSVVSDDGLVRDEALDLDADGVVDLHLSHAITEAADGTRTETTQTKNADGSLRSVVSETRNADGSERTIATDADGDGVFETSELSVTTELSEIATLPNWFTLSQVEVRNADGSLRSAVTIEQSADAMTTTEAHDLDGDGDVDLIHHEATAINNRGARETLVRQTNGDGSIRAMSKEILDADSIGSKTWVDLGQDGSFDATDLVRGVTVDAATGDRTTEVWGRAADGTILEHSVSVVSEDGLTRTSRLDADGDGDTDTGVTDVTTRHGDGSTSRRIETMNGDDSLRNAQTVVTSANGLQETVRSDHDGDGQDDAVTETSRVLNDDGSTVLTTRQLSGDGATLLSESREEISADRLTAVTHADTDGDGHVNAVTTVEETAAGARTVTEETFADDGTLIGRTITEVSADELTAVTSTDANGDGVAETVRTVEKVRNPDGSETVTETVRGGDESLRSQSVTTTSDDGLRVTTETDADGDARFERQVESVTTLNADGSVTETATVSAADGAILSQARGSTSDDGLVVTVENDADGDGSIDLSTTSATVLEQDGSTVETTQIHDAAGDLRSTVVRTTSDNQREVTVTTDINGDGIVDIVETQVIADDGVGTVRTQELATDGTIQRQSETVTSADGLRSTMRTDIDGDGIWDLTRESEVTLNVDGSQSLTLSRIAPDGSLISRETSHTSDDSLVTVETFDVDGDGGAEETTTATRLLNPDGSVVDTTEVHAKDGSLLHHENTETSADSNTVTTHIDLDGNENDDQSILVHRDDSGSVTTTTEWYSEGGFLNATAIANISADGLTSTYEWDANADGEADHVISDRTELAESGAVSRVVEHTNGRHVSLGSEAYLTSNDGMYARAQLDLDGDGLFDLTSARTTEYLGNGDTITRISTIDEEQDEIDEEQDEIGTVLSTVSGTGLETRVVLDLNADGAAEVTRSTILGAGGGSVETISYFGTKPYQLQKIQTITVSADGFEKTIVDDFDGDGQKDRLAHSVIDANGDTTTTFTDYDQLGLMTDRIVTFSSQTGLERRYDLDVDGDGVADITRETVTETAADGRTVTTTTESGVSGAQTDVAIREDSADGLTSRTSFDLDGDGTVEGTREETRTFHDDGRFETLAETHYADGDLRASSHVMVSADGRMTTEAHDYDGNGLADIRIEEIVRANGDTVTTKLNFNEAGVLQNRTITTVSADGLTTTRQIGAKIETISRSPVDNGSYTFEYFDGTIVSHEVDAHGIETWRLEETDGTVKSVRVDDAAKAQIIQDAALVYDTVLDRDMDRSEIEALVYWVDDATLDVAHLAQDLIDGYEFSTRYETLSTSEFINQIYLNTFGRAPSMQELADYLNADHFDRAAFAVDLALSSEHQVVGNIHRATNNFDVIANPAQFERSLDRSYVEQMIEALFDVVYDRAPTGYELEYFCERLLTGTDTVTDLASDLLAQSGGLHDVPTNPLKGLTGTALGRGSLHERVWARTRPVGTPAVARASGR